MTSLKTIWYLEPYKNHPWPDHEPTTAIVAASNEMEARELAAKHSSLIWHDKYNSSCQEIEEKSFSEPQFIADSIPCHEDDLLEDTSEYSAIVTSMWSMFLNIETSSRLQEEGVAQLLSSYEGLMSCHI